MRRKIDKVTEHYLIPLLLASGSIFLIVSFFYWNEWRNVAEENFLYPYYPINGIDEVKTYLAATSKTGIGYFAITFCCLFAILSKRRWLCLFSIGLSMVGLFFLL